MWHQLLTASKPKEGFIMGIFNAAKYNATKYYRKLVNGILSFWGLAYPYPSYIQLEPTKLCNMQCQMCMNPYLLPQEKGNMTYENFLKIIEQFPRTKTVILQGLGEIFLNPDILKMLKYLKENGYYVQFATNSSLLTNEVIHTLSELEIDEIRLSLDTLNPHLYKQIRGVDALDKVIENMKNLVRDVNQKSLVMVNMVASQDNYEEIADMVDFAVNNNIGMVRVSWIQQKGAEAQRKFISERMLPTMNLETMKKDAKKKGVKLLVNIPNKHHALNCQAIYNTLYITWDGFVTPCCHLENPKIINFGNILKTSFRKIWNGKKYKAFRKAHFDKESACMNCPHYTQSESM